MKFVLNIGIKNNTTTIKSNNAKPTKSLGRA
jgi:hypothetical protein